jgi:hypothetical protein
VKCALIVYGRNGTPLKALQTTAIIYLFSLCPTTKSDDQRR